MEYVSNQMGNINLLVNGFAFSKSAMSSGNFRWRCASRNYYKCHTSIIQDNVTNKLRFSNINHNHGEFEIISKCTRNLQTFYLHRKRQTAKTKKEAIMKDATVNDHKNFFLQNDDRGVLFGQPFKYYHINKNK